MSQTNELTRQILQNLYNRQIFAWRQNVAGIPLPQGGFRPGGKKGVSDILAILPPNGRLLCLEVKTEKDRLRPEQLGFRQNVERMGGLYLVVSSYKNFTEQLDKILSTS